MIQPHPAFEQPIEIIGEDHLAWRTLCGNHNLTGCTNRIDIAKRTGIPVDPYNPQAGVKYTTHERPTKPHLCMECGFKALIGERKREAPDA